MEKREKDEEKDAMSSQVLSVRDGAGEEGKGGEGDVEREPEDEELHECAHNGVEGEGRESGSELDGEDEVLYDTSSHEQLDTGSGVGGGEGTWEERSVLVNLAAS